MPYDRLMGMQILDEDGYAKYRELMEPILKSYGGEFRWDFRIAEVLRNEGGKKINRVFMVRFPNREAKDKLFSDERYLKIRKEFFDPSVGDITALGEYES